MSIQELKWDVRSRSTSEDLKLLLVKSILDRMSEEQLRSALHQYIYLQFHGYSAEQLKLEASIRGIEL